jgi:hypothetical protein
MNDRYFDGRWIIDETTSELLHFKGHYRTEGTPLDRNNVDIVIPVEIIGGLVSFLDKNSFIRPIMNEQSRNEDLKIVHRLLDTLQQNIGK